jgi:hypothetical protein
MGKSTNFNGQPIFNQLLTFIDKSEIRKIAKKHGSERYVKKFTTYNHLIVMLFVVFEGCHSIREVILGLLANAHKLSHLGLSYLVRRSTFSEANKRRDSKVFQDIYLSVYKKHPKSLADSRLTDKDLKRLFEFLTNNFELSAEKIALIYKKRWQIELLFKQLKQNFPLKYFLGDNENAIEIQIWSAILANLLITLVKSRIKRKWAFSNMVSIIRQQLMNYINIYAFLEEPERSWLLLIKEENNKYRHSLFPKI